MEPTDVRRERGTASHHRSHRRPGRHRAVLVRYDDDEYGVIARAAARAGLTPTGFVASVALAVAQATATGPGAGSGRAGGSATAPAAGNGRIAGGGNARAADNGNGRAAGRNRPGAGGR